MPGAADGFVAEVAGRRVDHLLVIRLLDDRDSDVGNVRLGSVDGGSDLVHDGERSRAGDLGEGVLGGVELGAVVEAVRAAVESAELVAGEGR